MPLSGLEDRHGKSVLPRFFLTAASNSRRRRECLRGEGWPSCARDEKNGRRHGWRACWSRWTPPRASSAAGGRGRRLSSPRSVPRAAVVRLDVARGCPWIGVADGSHPAAGRRQRVDVLDAALGLDGVVAAVERPRPQLLEPSQDPAHVALSASGGPRRPAGRSSAGTDRPRSSPAPKRRRSRPGGRGARVSGRCGRTAGTRIRFNVFRMSMQQMVRARRPAPVRAPRAARRSAPTRAGAASLRPRPARAPRRSPPRRDRASSRRHSALQPLALGQVALVGLEHLAHVQLRGDGAVPLVRLEPERDVVCAGAAEAVEAAADPERDRAARVAPVLADAELEVLALPHCGEVDELAAGEEQRHVRVAEPERRELRELGAEAEREVGSVHERVHQRVAGAGRPRRGARRRPRRRPRRSRRRSRA